MRNAAKIRQLDLLYFRRAHFLEYFATVLGCVYMPITYCYGVVVVHDGLAVDAKCAQRLSFPILPLARGSRFPSFEVSRAFKCFVANKLSRYFRFNYNYGMLGLLDRIHGTDTLFRNSPQGERHLMLLSFIPAHEQFPAGDKAKKLS